MNCWESKKCGREAKGSKVAELGVCPAYTKDAGQACWIVAGTFCDGDVQGAFAKKEHNRMKCDFTSSLTLHILLPCIGNSGHRLPLGFLEWLKATEPRATLTKLKVTVTCHCIDFEPLNC